MSKVSVQVSYVDVRAVVRQCSDGTAMFALVFEGVPDVDTARLAANRILDLLKTDAAALFGAVRAEVEDVREGKWQ